MLTKKIADEIVKETSIRLHRNVNIMDIDGLIIATGDTSRIGTIHEGALEVLKSGKTLIIHSNQSQDWEGAQPGINLPIVFQGDIIGVIGLTGDPHEIGDVGELVKMTTELMIKQEFIASQMEWKQRTKEMIIEELLKSKPSYNNIERGFGLLGFNFKPPFITITIQLADRSIPNQILIQKLEDAIGEAKGIVGFINVKRIFIALSDLGEDEMDYKVDSIYYSMKKLDILFQMSYSTPFYKIKKFSQSYMDCDLALKISDNDKEIVSFAQTEVKSLIYQVDETLSYRFSHRILKNLDKSKIKTLKAFLANDLSIKKTAEALFVHRNTLIYRLNKIINETGYDPKRFDDALILQVALWIFQKQTQKSKS